MEEMFQWRRTVEVASRGQRFCHTVLDRELTKAVKTMTGEDDFISVDSFGMEDIGRCAVVLLEGKTAYLSIKSRLCYSLAASRRLGKSFSLQAVFLFRSCWRSYERVCFSSANVRISD